MSQPAIKAEEDWCEQARRLVDGASQGNGEVLARVLGLIDAGIQLRRPLDRPLPETLTDARRRTLLRWIIRLRQAAEAILDAQPLAPIERDLLARKVKYWLADSRSGLRNLMSDPRVDPLGRALAVEGLRADLEWLSGLVARLDHEQAASPGAVLEVERDRLRKGLALSNGGKSQTEPERDRLQGRCERLRGVLLERTVRRELGSGLAGDAPERLLARRLQLSRLQARVSSLEQGKDGDGQPRWLGGDPEEWVETLAIRRLELADAAEASLQAMGLVRGPAALGACCAGGS